MDEEITRADYNASISFKGDVKAAQRHRRTAEKLVDKVMSQITQGTNLGQGQKHAFVVDSGTTVNLQILEGVTNPLVQIEIISGEEIVGADKPTEEKRTQIFCPQLPFGRPGARMFTQAILGGEDQPVWETFAPVLDETSDADNFCGEDGVEKVFSHTFPEDHQFWFGGVERKKFWIGANTPDIFFGGPAIIGDQYQLPQYEHPGSDTTVGGNFWRAPVNWDHVLDQYDGTANMRGPMFGFGMGAGCEPAPIYGSSTVIREGTVNLPTVDLGSGETLSVSHFFTSVYQNRPNYEAPGGQVRGKELETVMISFADAHGKSAYGQCAAAVGIFYGGPDGVVPFEWPPLLTSDPDICFEPQMQWWGPELAVQSRNLPLGCPSFQNVAGSPGGAYVVEKADWQATAWVQAGGAPSIGQAGEKGPSPGNSSMAEWAHGRSFWFYLDDEGHVIKGQASDSRGLGVFHWL
jgi:hypothetical protein